jgi:hypothetical protein
MIIVSSGSGTVTNINTTAPLSGGPITTSGTITTAMATNKLIGRSTSGTGVMEEITVGSGLTLTSGTLSSSGGATAAGNTNEIQFNNGGAFGASSNFDWIIADNRLLLGTENTADINSRMVVIGKGVSTNNTFVIHNSTGTNNALVVKDNGFIGFGALPYSATNKYRFNVGTDANLSIYNPSGTITRLQGVNDAANNGTPLHLNGNPLIFEQATTEYVRLDGTQFRIQNVAFNVNQSIGSGGAVSLLNLNNTNNQVATSILNFTIAGGNLAQLRAEATAGDDNVQIRVANSSGTLVEAARFQGTGNVLIGTTTDVASSILTLNSTTKGFLPPRMSTSDINNISTPATGLTVYNTTENKICFYDGTIWKKVNDSNL